jgi:A/G-specific adenine glycosylase
MPIRKRRDRNTADLAKRLLAWYGRHGRHDLPWQRRRTPYRVWVSEIMLQQTQVSTVIPYYRRFLASFPNIRRLADASQDDVLHLWTGLGYYARARNLHKAAQSIRDRHAGRFPKDFETVVALPGIGRSTAGAILALARDERHPILDGNVKRVLTRYHALPGYPGDKAVEKRLWVLADSHTPVQRTADYTQAIMDLGATVCTRTRPRCDACPLAAACRAHTLGRETDFPARRLRGKLPVRRTRMLMVRCGKRVLLAKRPPAGVWGGLWGFHEIAADADAAEWCRSYLAIKPLSRRSWPTLRHTFSHFHLDVEPVLLEVAQCGSLVRDNIQEVWYDLSAPPRLGLAAPVRRLLQTLRETAGDGDDTHGPLRLAG